MSLLGTNSIFHNMHIQHHMAVAEPELSGREGEQSLTKMKFLSTKNIPIYNNSQQFN